MTRDQKEFYFSPPPKRPDLLWALPSILFNGYRGSSSGRERPGREADRSSPFRAEFNNECDYTATLITCLPWVEGDGFTSTFICGWEAKQEVQMWTEPLADTLRTANDRRFSITLSAKCASQLQNNSHLFIYQPVTTVLLVYSSVFPNILNSGDVSVFHVRYNLSWLGVSPQEALLLVTSSRRNLGPIQYPGPLPRPVRHSKCEDDHWLPSSRINETFICTSWVTWCLGPETFAWNPL